MNQQNQQSQQEQVADFSAASESEDEPTSEGGFNIFSSTKKKKLQKRVAKHQKVEDLHKRLSDQKELIMDFADESKSKEVDNNPSLNKRKRKIEKLKEKKKKRKAEKTEKLSDTGPDQSQSEDDGSTLFWSKYCAIRGDRLTEIERQGGLPAGSFLASTTPPEPLPDFIKANLPDWKMKLASMKGKNKQFAKKTEITKQVAGSPRVLIICSGARRCVAILKKLAIFRCRAAKLFSKHMDIKEQQKLLKKCPALAVGTPNRLLKLTTLGSLNFESTEMVIFDMNKDAKNFTILDICGVREDLMNLFQGHIQPLLNKSSIKCALL